MPNGRCVGIALQVRLVSVVLRIPVGFVLHVRTFGIGRQARDKGGHLRRSTVLTPLEALEPGIDASPAGADEINEKREVVYPGVPLGEQLSFEPFESTNRLVEEAADLGDVTRNRKDLGPESVTNCDSYLGWNRRLKVCCCGCERFELCPRALESGFQLRRFWPSCDRVCDPLLGALQSDLFHGGRGYSQRRMDTALLDYELPPDLIAQRPLERRDSSRLLVYRRESGEIEHRVFSELPELLAGELVVVNDTRVVPARLRLRRATGGLVEVLLLEQVEASGLWHGLARPGRRLRAGERLGPVELVEPLGDGRWLLRLENGVDGDVPLPPYIREPLTDPERYQTVYARAAGSAAAPTAGLHFTPEALSRLAPVMVTLHIGLDTFRPVARKRLEDHELHGERYSVEAHAWERIAGAGRVLAVGTTTVRVVETVARTAELSGRTTLFITPGFSFRRVDALLTNFHLPRSTLLALVMAFVGVDEAREIYRTAVVERYRFYSFGDAMLAV
ncbi:MAG: tRNA preQ1(34) S-adenosylmethionine ribosyltransferase-isomerase QueA [Gaiellaceae bacterium]